jgi:hypothetical protein
MTRVATTPGASVSLTLGLQHHDSQDGGVNIMFGMPPAHHPDGATGYLFAPTADGGVHPGHHVQFDGTAG